MLFDIFLFFFFNSIFKLIRHH